MAEEFDSKKLELLKIEGAYYTELLKAAVAFEHAALKPLPFLNGGAIVAILAYFGNVAEHANGQSPALNLPARPLLAWCLGLVFWALAVFGGYISQGEYLTAKGHELNSHEDLAKVARALGRRWRYLAWACAPASVVMFLVGVGFAVISVGRN